MTNRGSIYDRARARCRRTGSVPGAVRRAFLPLVAALPVLFVGCGDDGEDGGAAPPPAEAVTHVHGLGVNPADGALLIATHAGLLRSPEGTTDAEHVGESRRDLMGFTVVGPDRFLASGHPGPGEEGPPHVGLIESTDAGLTWTEVSLAGEADFHVLHVAHERVYAYNALSGELMLSDDGGETWATRKPPGAMIDLAVDPENPERIVAATERGLSVSESDGRRWRPLEGEIGLLAWPESRALYLIDGRGDVQISADAGRSWKPLGEIGGQPAALAAVDEHELYAALGDGSVLASTDGGESWDVRSSP